MFDTGNTQRNVRENWEGDAETEVLQNAWIEKKCSICHGTIGCFPVDAVDRPYVCSHCKKGQDLPVSGELVDKLVENLGKALRAGISTEEDIRDVIEITIVEIDEES